jgi:hypothetical protein
MSSRTSSPLDETDAEKPPVDTDEVMAERRFPLVALLQLATFWAVIVACVDAPKLAAAINSAPRMPLLAAALLVAAVAAGGTVGFFIGLGQLRMRRNALAGAGVGMLYGIAILAVYLAPAPIKQLLVAAGVLLATTLAFRIRAA